MDIYMDALKRPQQKACNFAQAQHWIFVNLSADILT